MILLKFLPHEKTFNKNLSDMAVIAHQSCGGLKSLVLANSSDDTQGHAQAVLELKDLSKSKFESLTDALCRSFVTPFDREDMQELATLLYKIPKQANKVKNRLLAYDTSAYVGSFSVFIDIALEQGKALEEMIVAFNKHQMMQVHEKSQLIHDLENKCDDLLAQHLTSLSASDLHSKHFILMKDIFDLLEKMTDAFRDASDLALRIILKHS